MTTLYLIRHAEADGNVYRRVHGQYDGLITPRGYQQIQCLRRRFAGIPLGAVYASDLFRTRETARALYEGRAVPFTTTRELREIAFGEWEDLPWGELMLRYPEEYALWEQRPAEYRLAGAETYRDLYERIHAELNRIVRAHPGQTIAAVTHGTALRALLCVLRTGSLDRVGELPWCDNTAVAKLTVDENLRYTVEYYNDNSHLAQLSTLQSQTWWRDEEDRRLFNLHFVPAKFPQDLAKADMYYHDSWQLVFGDEEYDSSYTVSRMRRLRSAHPQAIVFARRGDGTEVGCVMLDTRAKLLPSGGHIALIYLTEPFRGREFGAQLLGHAVSVYRALGRRWITVRVAGTNVRAQKFYAKYGFEQFGAEQSPNTVQLLMRKSIDGTPAHINWK